jgi:hypothetical protein
LEKSVNKANVKALHRNHQVAVEARETSERVIGLTLDHGHQRPLARVDRAVQWSKASFLSTHDSEVVELDEFKRMVMASFSNSLFSTQYHKRSICFSYYLSFFLFFPLYFRFSNLIVIRYFIIHSLYKQPNKQTNNSNCSLAATTTTHTNNF